MIRVRLLSHDQALVHEFSFDEKLATLPETYEHAGVMYAVHGYIEPMVFAYRAAKPEPKRAPVAPPRDVIPAEDDVPEDLGPRKKHAPRE